MSEPRIKVVGRRKIGISSLEDADQLLRTAWTLRGTDLLVPKGVYRFRSFEEADGWMTTTMARTYVRQRSTTSRESAKPSTAPEPGTS